MYSMTATFAGLTEWKARPLGCFPGRRDQEARCG